jgi:polysaccharide export outer membrane protein
MPSAALAAEQSYVVGPEDELAITVWDHPDLGRKTRVNLEGMISFPLIGEVRAAGKSLIQLETDIKAKLANGFIVDPHVTIQITEYRSQKISIIGEVNQPGAYPLTKKTTLVEAIAMAGGVKQEADHEVMIVRPRTGNPKGGALLPNQVDPNDVIKVPIRDVLEGEKTHNIEVINGDTIFVPKIKVFYVTGEAKRPGQYTYLKGMTVLNAISTAGGFTEKASKRKVRIVREKGGKKEELAAALENQIEPGDTIVVPESFW